MPNRTPTSNILDKDEPTLTPNTLFAEPDESCSSQDLTPTPRDQLGVELRQAPDRTRSPFYPQYPKIIDSASLQAAVNDDPDGIYLAIGKIIHDRTVAQAQLGDLQTTLEGALQDHKHARNTWDHLLKIEKAKQVVLWKFIDRLQREIKIPKREDEERESTALSSYGKSNRTVQLDEALNEALSIAGSYPPSLSSVESRSNDSRAISTPRSMEWQVGSLDPSAVHLFPLLAFLTEIKTNASTENVHSCRFTEP